MLLHTKIFLLVLFTPSMYFARNLQKYQQRCEPIKIPMCKSMPYNMTQISNRLSQDHVKPLLKRLEPLLNTKCSKYLRFYICSRFVPICTLDFQHSDTIPPCRNICEAAKKGCEPLLIHYNLSWPRELDCSELPLYEKSVCVTPEAIVSDVEDKNINIIEKGTTEIDTAQCKCKNVPRLCRKLYLQGQYHYAIKAKVNSIKVHGDLTLINVTVLHVIKHTKIPLKVKANVFLWTINSSCPCPQLTIGKKYLIIGYEDVDNARLLYIFGSVGTRWRNVYTKRLSDWDRKLQRILKKRVKNKKVKEERRKRRRKNKKTPRYLRRQMRRKFLRFSNN